MKISIDLAGGLVTREEATDSETFPLGSAEGFGLVSMAWLRAGWDAKYVYSFSWLGRPIIQLPEDLLRIQEVIYSVRPDVIIETGVAHGGALVFYASVLRSMAGGRVVGIDVSIRAHNRGAIERHELSDMITLIEGDSVARDTVGAVMRLVGPDDRVMVMLDSRHTRDHVLTELRAYAPLVSVGSYIVAMDGIMGDVAGAPRTESSWSWDNPREAAREFVATNPKFIIEEPPFPFNEGVVRDRVTYWPAGFIRRISQ